MNKKNVQLTTYMGLIPFYAPLIYFFIKENDSNNSFIIQIPLIYGAVIASFISGMQWEKLISNQYKNSYVAILPLVIAWSHFFVSSIFISTFLLILALFTNLFIDLTLLSKVLDHWFKKMRIIVTVLVSISLIINFLSIFSVT